MNAGCIPFGNLNLLYFFPEKAVFIQLLENKEWEQMMDPKEEA